MNITLLHGKGGNPTGSVLSLQAALEQIMPEGTNYFRPVCPHTDENLTPEVAYARFVEEILPQIAPYSIVIGVSMGGLCAMHAQETVRPDLNVIAISSPEHAGTVEMTNDTVGPRIRTLFYSPTDSVIAGRMNYPEAMDVYELPWLTHHTIEFAHSLSLLIHARIEHYLGAEVVEEVTKGVGSES